MGVILVAIVVAIAIAIGAGVYMRSDQEPSWQAYTASGVRVGDPGSNLVGPGWTGENQPGAASAAAEGKDTAA